MKVQSASAGFGALIMGFASLACFAPAIAGEATPSAAAAAPAITVELNKLETVDKGCRV